MNLYLNVHYLFTLMLPTIFQVENFVEHLSSKIVNDQVFPKIESGFLDSEPLIREKTVISMIHLAPKLNYSNLDEMVVMKHFTRFIAALNSILIQKDNLS